MSRESNNVHNGYFARIIRDALCRLPDMNDECEPLMLEQQVVEYAESATPVKSPSNIARISTQTPETLTPATVSQAIALQNSPAPAASAHGADNAKAKASDQHSIATAFNEIATAPADKSAADFPHNTPHNHRALTQQHAGKKVPLAITVRHAPNDQELAATRVAAQKYATATAPAAKADPAMVSAEPAPATANTITATNIKSTKTEPANPTTQRQPPPTAAPLIAKSARAEDRLPERKAAAPSLRIGAVTIRVVDAAPAPAVSSQASRPAARSSGVDPIASAESRHFLRTL